MSQRIARLLAEEERHLTKLIGQLEAKNGYPSHDARLLAETIQKVRLKLHDLNLDPDDTTAEELYQALQVKFRRDALQFEEFFKADQLNFEGRVAKAIQLLQPYTNEARLWGLKTKAAKEIIRQKPPKRLMKYLNYRSVESMLKREDLSEIYLAADRLESESWLKAHKAAVNKLSPTSFEIRQLKLVNLNSTKWADANFGGWVVQNDELAALAVWPTAQTQTLPLLSIILLMAERLSQFSQLDSARLSANLNGIIVWWADMDHLMVELSNQPVSLNLFDTAINHLHKLEFADRHLARGRKAFWRELVSRYNNLPDIDGVFDSSVLPKIAGLKQAAPQPAYEFAEEIDG